MGGYRPYALSLLVRLVEVALAIGILITILLQSCTFGARVWGGTGRVDFIRMPKLKAILPYLCISTTCRPGFVLVHLATLMKTMFCVCVPPALFSHCCRGGLVARVHFLVFLCILVTCNRLVRMVRPYGRPAELCGGWVG